ncbi:MAG TPA: FHA domain-containing protein [Ktedonobacteraceae bacterium]|nr:FHA domain-containing protein [Ktedonobacteraceae bacterium]
MLAITINALYTTLHKRGTTRQLAGAIVASVVSALLLLPALLWYNIRFTTLQAALPVGEIGLMLFYVALCGWTVPFAVTATYCLFTGPRDSHTAGRLPRQRKRITRAREEAVTVNPPRRQPGVPAPYVYSADKSWGWLVYRNGNFAGQELALKHSVVSIGREEDNEVWLDDDTISRYHAELAWYRGQVYATDNGSLNGILLNGQSVRSSRVIQAGDELEIGSHKFVLKLAQKPVAGEDLDDPLLPQLRRISASRGGGGNSSPGSKPGEKRLAGPTVALNPPHEEAQAIEKAPVSRQQNQEESLRATSREQGKNSSSPALQAEGLCVILNGEMAGRSFLLDRPVLIVGRGNESDIIIADRSLSRRHAQFSHQADGNYVQDLTSSNGSQVNGTPLNTPRRLRQGDKIILGDVRIEYTLLPEAQTTLMPLSEEPPQTPFNPPLPFRLPSRFKDQ